MHIFESENGINKISRISLIKIRLIFGIKKEPFLRLFFALII